jgi:hypothetical protein
MIPTTGPYCFNHSSILKWRCFEGKNGTQPTTGKHSGPRTNSNDSHEMVHQWLLNLWIQKVSLTNYTSDPIKYSSSSIISFN